MRIQIVLLFGVLVVLMPGILHAQAARNAEQGKSSLPRLRHYNVPHPVYPADHPA